MKPSGLSPSPVTPNIPRYPGTQTPARSPQGSVHHDPPSPSLSSATGGAHPSPSPNFGNSALSAPFFVLPGQSFVANSEFGRSLSDLGDVRDNMSNMSFHGVASNLDSEFDYEQYLDKDEKVENVRVIARFRPQFLHESKGKRFEQCVDFPDAEAAQKVVRFKPSPGDKSARRGSVMANFDEDIEYYFDRVFPPGCQQVELYDYAAKHIVEDILKGKNGAIFAYGQTGSGKTYTMKGPNMTDEELKGITPRCIDAMFDGIRNAFPGSSPYSVHEIRASYVEVYMEKVRDLLDRSKENLTIHDDKEAGTSVIVDATEFVVETPDELFEVVRKGNAQRSVMQSKVVSTALSGRGHAVLKITVKQSKPEDADSFLSGTLYLVDLAGTEKGVNTDGLRFEQSKLINQSLSALGNVILSLTDPRVKHVNYRDSKLTRILKDCLSGNSRTSLIVCASTARKEENETMSTLKFGSRTKKVRLRPKTNRELSKDEYQSICGKMHSKINALTDILRYKDAIFQEKGYEEGLAKDRDMLADQLNMIREQCEALSEGNNAMGDDIGRIRAIADELGERHEALSVELENHQEITDQLQKRNASIEAELSGVSAQRAAMQHEYDDMVGQKRLVEDAIAELLDSNANMKESIKPLLEVKATKEEAEHMEEEEGELRTRVSKATALLAERKSHYSNLLTALSAEEKVLEETRRGLEEDCRKLEEVNEESNRRNAELRARCEEIVAENRSLEDAALSLQKAEKDALTALESTKEANNGVRVNYEATLEELEATRRDSVEMMKLTEEAVLQRNFMLEEMDVNKKRIDEMNREMAGAEAEANRRREEMALLESEREVSLRLRESLAAEHRSLSGDVKNLREKRDEYQTKTQDLREELASLEQEETDHKESIDELQRIHDELETQVRQYRNERGSIEKSVGTLDEEKRQLLNQIEALRQETDGSQNSLESLRNQIQCLEKEQSSLEKEKSELDDALSVRQEMCTQLKVAVAEAKEAIGDAEVMEKEWDLELRDLIVKRDEYNKSTGNLSLTRDKMRKECDELSANVEKIEEENALLVAHRDDLTQQVAVFQKEEDTLTEAVNELKANAESKQEAMRSLQIEQAELIEVIQATEQTRTEALEQDATLRHALETREGEVQLAQKRLEETKKLVDEEMGGCSEIKTKITELETDLSKHRSQREGLQKQLKDGEEESAQLRGDVDELSRLYKDVLQDIKELKEEKKVRQSKVQKHHAEHRELNETYLELQEQLSTSMARTQDLESRIKVLRDEISRSSSGCDEKTKELSDLQRLVSEGGVQEKNLSEEWGKLRARAEELRVAVDEKKQECKVAEEEISALQTHQREYNHRINMMNHDRETLSHSLSGLEERCSELEHTLGSVENVQRMQEARRNELAERVRGTQDSISTLTSEGESLRSELEGLLKENRDLEESTSRLRLNWTDAVKSRDDLKVQKEKLEAELQTLMEECGTLRTERSIEDRRRKDAERELHELKEWRAVMGNDVEILEDMIGQERKALAEYEVQKTTMSQSLEASQATVQSLRGEVEEVQKEILRLNADRSDLKGSLEELLPGVSELRATKASLEQEKISLDREIESLTLSTAGLKKDKATLDERCERARREKESLLEGINGATNDVELLEDQVAELKEGNISKSSRNADLVQSLSRLQEENSQLGKTHLTLSKERDGLSADVEEARKNLSKSQDDTDKLKVELQSLDEEKKKSRAEYLDAEKCIEEAVKELVAMNKCRDEVERELFSKKEELKIIAQQTALLEQESNDVGTKHDALRSHSERLAETTAGLNEEVETLHEKVSALEVMVGPLNDQKCKLEARKKELEGEIEELSGTIDTTRQHVYTLDEENTSIKSEREALLQKSVVLSRENTRLYEMRRVAEEEKVQMQAEYDKLDVETSKVLEDNDTLRLRLESLEMQRSDHRDINATLHSEYNGLTSVLQKSAGDTENGLRSKVVQLEESCEQLNEAKDMLASEAQQLRYDNETLQMKVKMRDERIVNLESILRNLNNLNDQLRRSPGVVAPHSERRSSPISQAGSLTVASLLHSELAGSARARSPTGTRDSCADATRTPRESGRTPRVSGGSVVSSRQDRSKSPRLPRDSGMSIASSVSAASADRVSINRASSPSRSRGNQSPPAVRSPRTSSPTSVARSERVKRPSSPPSPRMSSRPMSSKGSVQLDSRFTSPNLSPIGGSSRPDRLYSIDSLAGTEIRLNDSESQRGRSLGTEAVVRSLHKAAKASADLNVSRLSTLSASHSNVNDSTSSVPSGNVKSQARVSLPWSPLLDFN